MFKHGEDFVSGVSIICMYMRPTLPFPYFDHRFVRDFIYCSNSFGASLIGINTIKQPRFFIYCFKFQLGLMRFFPEFFVFD